MGCVCGGCGGSGKISKRQVQVQQITSKKNEFGEKKKKKRMSSIIQLYFAAVGIAGWARVEMVEITERFFISVLIQKMSVLP